MFFFHCIFLYDEVFKRNYYIYTMCAPVELNKHPSPIVLILYEHNLCVLFIIFFTRFFILLIVFLNNQKIGRDFHLTLKNIFSASSQFFFLFIFLHLYGASGPDPVDSLNYIDWLDGWNLYRSIVTGFICYRIRFRSAISKISIWTRPHTQRLTWT